MNGHGISVSNAIIGLRRGVLLTSLSLGACYSPDRDIAGKYDFNWAGEVLHPRDQGEIGCESPGGGMGTASELEVIHDAGYSVVVHLGCKVRVTKAGSVLSTSGFEKCELVPGSQAEALGFMNRYYNLRIDLSSGNVFMASTNLGQNSGELCLVADGRMKRPGAPPPNDQWFGVLVLRGHRRNDC